MLVNVEKRTRAASTDNWGAWAITTDAPPYTNTDLVEYRAETNIDVDIDINALTNGSVVDTAGVKTWEGTGVFDELMQAVNGNLQVEWKNNRIRGAEYAQVYLGGMQSVIQNSIQFLLQKENVEVQAATRQYQLNNILPIQRDKAQEEYDLMEDTHDAKVRLTEAQADQAENQAELIEQQENSLAEQTIDNRKIKALDSLADTYGTFGAGGSTLSSDMWNTYFQLVASLVSKLTDYKGEWDASTNTPDISAIADPVPGDFYRVSVAGSTNLDGTDSWSLNDIVVFVQQNEDTGGYWKKSDVVLPANTTVSKVV